MGFPETQWHIFGPKWLPPPPPPTLPSLYPTGLGGKEGREGEGRERQLFWTKDVPLGFRETHTLLLFLYDVNTAVGSHLGLTKDDPFYCC
jgi:hypothetical protein